VKLQGKVAIVTGASRGIGKAVAVGFAKEGARVVIVARDEPSLKETAGEIQRIGQQQQVLPITGDLSQETVVFDMVKKAERAFGRIDILVNNAGILTPRSLIHEVEISDWDRSLAMNLRAPFLCIQAVLPQMIQLCSGVIINVSSGAGKRAAPTWGPYAVAKFGVEGLTKLVAAEVEPYRIRVNAVNPGGVRTSMRAMAYPDEEPTTLPAPEETVPLFVWLASDESQGVTGESIDWREWVKDRNSPRF